MGKKLIGKLKSRLGETLIESLAAILIFTLSSIALLSMLSSSADINATAKEMDDEFQKQLVIAEQADEKYMTEGIVTFKINKANGKDETSTVSVSIYHSEDDGALYSYYAKEDAGS